MVLTAFDLLFWLALGLEWLRGVRKVPVLRDVADGGDLGAYPSVNTL